MRPLVLNQKDAASYLSIGVNTFKRHVRHELPAVYIAGATRYRVSDLDAWVIANMS